MTDLVVERVARAICEADPRAPHPDAYIYIGTRPSRAWKARVPQAKAAIDAIMECYRRTSLIELMRDTKNRSEEIAVNRL